MLLEMKNVVKQFGGLTAVSNMSFSVEKGEIFGVIGPNGAGKTTIFNLITGVYQVTEGDILFDGQSIEGKKPYQIINMGISRTFQNIRLFKELSVIDNIKVGLHESLRYDLASSLLRLPNYWKEEKKCTERALELLDIFHMADLANVPAGSLPYGAQRRLEIMRALATSPKLLLLDEPVSGLDPKVTAEMYHLIETLNRQEGITILMISHDIRAAVCYASHILHIGESVFFGTRGEYLQSPQGRLFAAGKGGAV